MRYKSQPYPLFIFICIGIGLMYIPFLFISRPIQLISTIILTIMLLILLFREHYEIKGTVLYISRGFSNHKIAILSIRFLNIARYGTRLGLEISSETRTIVLFPKEMDQMVMMLMKINPDIKLINGDLNIEPVS